MPKPIAVDRELKNLLPRQNMQFCTGFSVSEDGEKKYLRIK